MASGTKLDYMNSMLNAASEIEQLRKQNELLSAQMQVVTIFAAALGFKAESRGMGEDMAWRLRKLAEAIKEDWDRENATSEGKTL